MKKCSQCKQIKPTSEFTKHRRNSDGLSCECKKCKSKRHAEYSARFRAKFGISPSQKYLSGRPNEYNVWRSMNRRCSDPRNDNYKYYGGKGIIVCDRWRGKGGFEKFLIDMGKRPSKDHQIDRIDANGNYEPGNCRWLLKIENTRRSSGVKLDMHKAKEIRTRAANGEKQRQLAEDYGVGCTTISDIIQNKKWNNQHDTADKCGKINWRELYDNNAYTGGNVQAFVSEGE